ncbi:unnamed protein product [Mytilus edulis]|uniref:Tyr recombinase domain-containing protein n=1 Tax=Mytilus edulis TaxID=6550 RepID=A0A8S3Q437_MYTED|nr:unnamed protein product [Mytilus edulis]
MSDMEEETLDLASEQGTSTRNPHEMSNADLFSLLKTYMDTRLSGIETSFTDTTHTLEKKKIFSTGFWKNDTQVKHTELKILFRKMKNSVIDSKARNTTVKYAYSFKRFVVWSEKYTEIKSVLPADEIYVSLYLQYLMQSAKHYSTIEAACYAIKWAHSLAGFEDPCASDIVKCIVEASKRKLNRPIHKKEPMNANIMLSLFKKFGGTNSSLKNLRLLAMCFLAYSGFLRYSELCQIRAKNITFGNDHIDIYIESSKTDCYRKGKNVLIAKLDQAHCPVKILSDYLDKAKIDRSSDDFVFRALSYCKSTNNCKLRKNNIQLSYTRTREIVKRALSEIGLNARIFGTHSFSAGGCSAASNAGVSNRSLKIHGRWKSDIAKDSYISDNLKKKRLLVSKSLGL